MTVRAVSNNPVSPFYNANAPNLTGQVGSLTALLDAVLVNGFSGFTNLGWTINQTTTNKRGYLQNTSGSNNPSGELLYVDDTGPGAGGAREARWCGFETMSAITPVGTGQFPTFAQLGIGAGGVVYRKSATADSTVRFWTAIGDGHTIYLFSETGDVITPVAATFLMFGDFFSYKSSDSYAVSLYGRNVENSANNNCEWFSCTNPQQGQQIMTPSHVQPGHFVTRSWTGIGGSVAHGKFIDLAPMGVSTFNSTGLGNTTGGWFSSNVSTSVIGSLQQQSIGRNINVTNFPYPNGPDGALWMSPIRICHNNSIRGYYKGLWAPLHDMPLNHNDTFTVSGGNLNGKSFIALNFATFFNGGNGAGQIIVETSDTWT